MVESVNGQGQAQTATTRQDGASTPPAANPASANPAPAKPPARAEEPRADSYRCPTCGKHGCNAVGGTRRTASGVVRYRVCKACKKRCVTETAYGTNREVVVVANYRGEVPGPEKGSPKPA